MVTDDANDKAYAEALRIIFDNTGQLSPDEIQDKFYEVGSKFFPDDTGPKNLMLQEIHTGVDFDELNPYFPDNDQKYTLERFRKITDDYLKGNYYPSYFALSGNYDANNQGFTWDVHIKNNGFVIKCANQAITGKLHEIADQLAPTGQDDVDLKKFQNQLPAQIAHLTLRSSELDEYLPLYSNG